MRRSLMAVLTLAIILGLMIPLSARQTKNFQAHLSGGQEVPAVDSGGQGQAIFKVDGDQVHFKLITANLNEITQAHIHCGPAGDNFPVLVFLFGFVAGGVDNNGVLNSGTFTADDFLPTCGFTSIDDLVEAMATGNAYVNVHTLDFAGGEIRGQIR